MPKYLLRFTAESCLENDADVAISYEGVDVRFLFSKRQPDDRYLKIELEIEAINNREAQNSASSTLLPPVLDALSFATGTPLLLIECELILKDETGSLSRRAIYVGHKKTPKNIALPKETVSEAIRILQTEEVRLPVCWHRYALDRQLPFDQFVFNWLAFESLAGDADIASRCPQCGQPLTHCGKLVTHTGSSRARAAQIYCAANPDTTVAKFNREVWNTARNRVFHGRRYPAPAYLAELFGVSTSLRKASERRIADLAGVTGDKPQHRYEDLFRVFFFVEWRTADASQKFAVDWPETELVRRTNVAELNRVFSGGPPKNVSFLDYPKQSPAW